MEKYHRLADLLLSIEMHMRNGNIWQMPIPTAEDLASHEPFCMDTMSFDQWIRFVMLEKYKILIEQQGILPEHSNILPVAELFFQDHQSHPTKSILGLLKALDELINE